MTRQLRLTLSGSLAALIALAAPASIAAELNPAELEFFEKKVRPVLADNCYECHSARAQKLKGGLRLDFRDGLLEGGDSGPALVPGNPDGSLLIKAVRQTDEHLQMPPKDKKLKSEEIADLEAWVKMGAPDPRVEEKESPKVSNIIARHWAFEPVKQPALPSVMNRRWPQSPVDLFILAKLEQNGLRPSSRADKYALLRRVTFDLIGLPPTEQEVQNFLADDSPAAFAKVVDRLLASPHHGERWARHWLDVARYADTKGYVFEEERRYAYAYTYRDYVIRAFNEDLPFDRFVIEQIAADHLELGDDKRPLAAMGFLTLGRRFLNNPHDIIDDRLDVVGRGLMGLTIGCARCHDHKYDPIPIADYYSLYGVFASSSEPGEKPLLGMSSLPKAYPEYVAGRKKRQDELDQFVAEKNAEARTQLRQRAGDYLLAALDVERLEDKSRSEALARERKLDPSTVQRWQRSLEKWAKIEMHPVFAPWLAFAKLGTNEFAAKTTELSGRFVALAQTNLINPPVAALFGTNAPQSIKEVAERYGKLFTDVDKQWQELLAKHKASATNSAKAPEPSALPDVNLESIRQILYASDSPAHAPDNELRRLYDVPSAQKARRLQRLLEEFDATHPGSPPRAMSMKDNSSPTTPRVFVRGNANNPGPEVPRQFLGLLAGEKRKPFEKGSGRLELAQAIASRDNPLTARVLVNRVWAQYFGAGLVRTPSDFGLRSDPPTHPELLDWLAWQFMEDGWSLKKLHRLILLSSVYQQASDENPRSTAIDPNNQFLWRMNRRRLDFEAMRDSLLAASGKLDLAMGGLPVEMTAPPFPARRTIYGFVERQNLPAMFRTFDFASPDTTSPQRFQTTVPQQALFMLNSPFVVQQARHALERPEVAAEREPEFKVRALHRIAFRRDPSLDETRMALEFIQAQEKAPAFEPELPAWRYGFGKVDESTRRVVEFQPLPKFVNNAWQGGDEMPDAKLGWVMLNATGGHPGDTNHAVIRRWVAPRDLVVAISGTLGHDSDKGDGVRGRIISSTAGELGSWTAKKSKAETKIQRVEVKKGDALDFVVEQRESLDSDAFTWSPSIKLAEPEANPALGRATDWNARTDFSGPREVPQPLNPWEKYAQVLLISNETIFLD